jgi:hypothetical protein
MHQNMKSFCELQAIKKEIEIAVILSPIKDAQLPTVLLKINEKELFNGEVNKKLRSTSKINLLEKIDIKITLINKNYKISSNTAVIIDSLTLDTFDIVPAWTQLATYKNDQNMLQPTNYLGFNGTWNLKINEPFYRWKHRITGQGWLLEP